MAGVSQKEPLTKREKRIKELEQYLCSAAVGRNDSTDRITSRWPEACRNCTNPCAYGAEWVKLLTQEQASAELKAAKAARKSSEPEKQTVQETITADLQEARIEELQAQLKRAEAGTRELEKEQKKLRDALASADGVAARAEAARKNADKRVKVLLEEREKLTKEAEEARALLEVVTGERDEAERERQAAERKRDELREIAEREHMACMAAKEMCIRLKATLWDMEHPTGQT